MKIVSPPASAFRLLNNGGSANHKNNSQKKGVLQTNIFIPLSIIITITIFILIPRYESYFSKWTNPSVARSSIGSNNNDTTYETADYTKYTTNDETADDRPTFHLHIGMPKTATTYLKCSLCSNPNTNLILGQDNWMYIGTCPHVRIMHNIYLVMIFDEPLDPTF